MKLLLDEAAPRRLASSFPQPFTLRTVQEMGWAGTGNDLLLRLAAAAGLDALVTVDRGIEHQQNVNEVPLPLSGATGDAVNAQVCSGSTTREGCAGS